MKIPLVLAILFIGSISFAQVDSIELGYQKDLKIRDKVYELYVTPRGDEVLMKKEAAQEDGEAMYKMAKEVIKKQAQVSMAAPFINIQGQRSSVKRILEQRNQLAQKGALPETSDASVVKSSSWGWVPIVPQSLEYRPKAFNRRYRGELALNFGGYVGSQRDDENEDKNQDNNESGLSGWGYALSVDRDLHIFVKPNRWSPDYSWLTAFSAGVFYSGQSYIHYYGNESQSAWLNDAGVKISLRTGSPIPVWDAPGFVIETTALVGKNGTRSVVTVLKLGIY